MAFTLPSYTFGAHTPGNGIRLPAFAFGEIPVAVGVRLPSYTFGEFTRSSGLTLPSYGFGEALPSTFALTASGGFTLGGYADIFGDPVVASGGFTLSGAAVVSAAFVLRASFVGNGGFTLGGTAPNSFYWVRTAGAGGFTLSGAAVVRAPRQSADGVSSVVASAEGAVARLWLLEAESSVMAQTAASIARLFEEAVESIATTSSEAGVQRLLGLIATSQTAVATGANATGAYALSVETLVEVLTGIKFINDYLDGWAYNLTNGAPSKYEGFNFNSFAKVGSQYFGANESGLHVLSGDKDGVKNIDALVATGTPGNKGVFRVDGVYAGMRSETPMRLTCRVESKNYSYVFEKATPVMEPVRAKPGKGLRGRYWQFEVSNQDGGDFEIDSLEVSIAPATRKL